LETLRVRFKKPSKLSRSQSPRLVELYRQEHPDGELSVIPLFPANALEYGRTVKGIGCLSIAA
jgi:hypothetical protein